jgi:hypothetical protein
MQVVLSINPPDPRWKEQSRDGYRHKLLAQMAMDVAKADKEPRLTGLFFLES